MNVTTQKLLIVNADDFGLSQGVNQGIIEAHEHGIVTSSSLMVRWPGALEAVAYSRKQPKLSLGLHLDLGEWAYHDETWIPVYEVVSTEDITAVTDEVSRQLATFRSLVGKEPTHLDSHQHVHLQEPVRSIVVEAAHTLGIPLRHYSPTIRYCGEFYGQTTEGYSLPDTISVGGLIKILATLQPGITELCCHPGLPPLDLDTMYRYERAAEVQALCDPRVRKAMASLGIALCSFDEITSV